MGGHDVGNSNESVIEGDFFGSLFLHSHHPIKLSFSPIFPARWHTSTDPQSGYSGSHFYDPVIVSTTLG